MLYSFDAATLNLMTISTATGSGARIGNNDPFVPDSMAFDPLTGRVFAAKMGEDALMLYDRTNGNASFIGATGYADITGLAFDPKSRTLYGITTAKWVGGGGVLLRLNTSTGAATEIGQHKFTLTALAFDTSTETLYALWTVNDRSRLTGTTLVALNRFTGEISAFIGTLHTDPNTREVRASGLSYDAPSNTLYAVLYVRKQIARVDPTNGLVELLPSTVGFAKPHGLAPSR